MGQPKDYPTGHSITYGNGRINSLFNTINAVAIVLITAALIWAGATLTKLNTQVAVLISQNETRVNDYARLDRRITTIERDRLNSSAHGNKQTTSVVDAD